MKKKTLVIAEIGVNHNGDVDVAKEMIEKAAWAGADAVKFQTFNVELNYNTEKTSDSKLNWAKNLSLAENDFVSLKYHAEMHDLIFLSTPFDLKSAFFLNELDVTMFKIASSSLFEIPLLKKLSEFKKPVLLSTGMATEDEIHQAIKVLYPCEITLLYCVSLYPTPYHLIDLNMLQKLENNFKLKVGLSDHSIGIEVPIASIPLNVTVIEKHFKLENQECPDKIVSLDPSNFKRMVNSIRNVEKTLGSGEFYISNEEKEARANLRKGIYYTNNKVKNEILTEDDITLKKPAGELGIENYYKIIGKKMLVNTKAGSEIKLKDLF